jgi:two-component system KDP operon response regulator KdpE
MDRGTVLVVEDDAHLRRLFRDLLLGEGYRVVEAEDALEAVQALQGRRPGDRFSVVLVDMTRPHDGVQVLRHVAERDGATAVVAVSGSDAGLAAARDAGAQTTLGKPFEIGRLLECVRQCSS